MQSFRALSWVTAGGALALSLMADVSRADSFTPGNLVIYRVGDGSAALANTGNAIFVDEYTTTGILVQSIPLPTAASGANQPLIASGTSTSEGLLTRSADGQYIVLTGYATTMSASGSLSSSLAADVPRGVGRVSFDGSVDTSTALTDFADGNNPRGVASTDGVSLWVAGADSDSAVRYTTLGGKSSLALSNQSKNGRAVNIFAGQLYMSSQKTSIRIATVGTGLPTTAGQTVMNLPGYPTSGAPDAFFFADLDPNTPGLDTLYVAEDTNDGGEIQKYSLAGASWIFNGSIPVPNVRGLTGMVSGTSVTLFATQCGIDGTSGTLYSVIDRSGYNDVPSNQVATLATALTNQAFRGVALAPVGAAPSTPTSTASPKSTPTRTLTPTPTLGTPLPTVPPGSCVGDCTLTNSVHVSDLIIMVNIALDVSPVSACTAGDANKDGVISVNEIVGAVNNALNGCPQS